MPDRAKAQQQHGQHRVGSAAQPAAAEDMQALAP